MFIDISTNISEIRTARSRFAFMLLPSKQHHNPIRNSYKVSPRKNITTTNKKHHNDNQHPNKTTTPTKPPPTTNQPPPTPYLTLHKQGTANANTAKTTTTTNPTTTYMF